MDSVQQGVDTVETEAAKAVEDLLNSPERFINREFSWLQFNRRVLEETLNTAHPLLERVRFLSISATNLDEFFEIRAATVRQAQDFGMPLAADGIPYATLLKRIHDRAAELVDAQYRCWNEVLLPALSESGVRVLHRQGWNARQTRWLRAYFRDEVMPVLSPRRPISILMGPPAVFTTISPVAGSCAPPVAAVTLASVPPPVWLSLNVSV